MKNMKTILIDAFNTFVIEGKGIDQELFAMLKEFPNPKIILTNANDEQVVSLGLENLPYELFSLKHNPDKTDKNYYEKLLSEKGLDSSDVVYFEHNLQAVESAKSVGITTYHFDHIDRDFEKLREFLVTNLD